MKTTIYFYEGSYQFDSVTTELNVTEDFIEMKLAQVYAYRNTVESLWATVVQENKEVARYKFKFGEFGLTNISENPQANIENLIRKF